MGNTVPAMKSKKEDPEWRQAHHLARSPDDVEIVVSNQDEDRGSRSRTSSAGEAISKIGSAARRRLSSTIGQQVEDLKFKAEKKNRQGVVKDVFRCSMYGTVADMEKCILFGDDVHTVDKYSRNCFTYACMGANLGTIAFLADQGVQTDLRDMDGKTPLHWVAESDRNQNAIQVMADSGCDLNVTDNEGNTALHAACENGQAHIIVKLLRMGADPSLTNEKGQTAKDLVMSSSQPVSVQNKIKKLLKTIRPLNATMSPAAVTARRQSLSRKIEASGLTTGANWAGSPKQGAAPRSRARSTSPVGKMMMTFLPKGKGGQGGVITPRGLQDLPPAASPRPRDVSAALSEADADLHADAAAAGGFHGFDGEDLSDDEPELAPRGSDHNV